MNIITVRRILYVGTTIGFSLFAVYFFGYVLCANSFGIELNQRRNKLGIPIIPRNWIIRKQDKNSVWWQAKDDLYGHKWKIVGYSICTIEYETDEYFLRPLNGKKRFLEIEYHYSNKDQKSLTTYTYQVDSEAIPISKMHANHILDNEKIKKDY